MRATEIEWASGIDEKHCCRMDVHVPHLWWGQRTLIYIEGAAKRPEYFCQGLRIHEGGFGHG